MMAYYEVLAGSQRYHGNEALTYASTTPLKTGVLVLVPLRNEVVVGVVLQKTTKPTFKTKSILKPLGLRSLPSESIELLNWMTAYYPAPLGVITSQFIPRSLTREARGTSQPKPINPVTLVSLPPLTTEQRTILRLINKTPRDRSVLLHGDTGTGKTRVYIELAKQEINKKRSVLVLTPEISLTPQLVRDFEQAFGPQVVVIHSNLTDAERRKAWLRVLETDQPLIVVGPRSALFVPFPSLGLIVIDEAHETAYKQEQAPYYYAHRVAAKLASVYNARLILGTATPNVSDYYVAQAKDAPILRMSTLATSINDLAPQITVVNARDITNYTRSPHLSDELLNAIQTALRNREQALVFLNRRGTARLVVCQVCGWQATCPICDLPLTYHGDSHLMRCHTCGYKAQAISLCPTCNSTDILYKSVGTKSIVVALARLFPKAHIQRFDTDNKKSERFEQHYKKIAGGTVDIIVGTQLLVKGLDLPNLSVVGVVAADTSLSFPDYTAEERTYQLLTQVIGRIGRGHRTGSAIIQTYNPDSPAIKAAVRKDWESFYAIQLAERKQFLFPPFCYILKLTCVRKSPEAAQKASTVLMQRIHQIGLPIRLVGPAPSFYEKTTGGYRWQIIVKAKNRSHLLSVVKMLPANWTYNLDPLNLL